MEKEVSKLQPQQTPISFAVIKAFFTGKDAGDVAEKVTQLESSRINSLVRHFEVSGIDDVKTAVKDLKTDAKKTHGEKSKEHRTAGVRASEIQTLYGAWRFADLKPTEIKGGYHAIVGAAREVLKAKAIRWTGERIPEDWERSLAKKQAAKHLADDAVEYEREQHKRLHGGDEPTAEKLEEIRAKAQDEIRKNGAVSMARKLYEKQGAEFCLWLIDALENAIAAGEEVQGEGSMEPVQQQAAA